MSVFHGNAKLQLTEVSYDLIDMGDQQSHSLSDTYMCDGT